MTNWQLIQIPTNQAIELESTGGEHDYTASKTIKNRDTVKHN